MNRLLSLSLVFISSGSLSASDFSLSHSPKIPKPDSVVTVTAKLPEDVKTATLKIQSVAPGQYIRKIDPAFDKSWTDLAMKPEHGEWRVTVPANQQKHRHLFRYKVTFETKQGKKETYPAADSPCPNQTWYCDRGTFLDWSDSIQPKSEKLTFTSKFFESMPALTLIANFDDVAKSQWDDKFYKQKQWGTIVYQGEVFDHIQYSNRGQASTYSSGKNKWAVKFQKDRKLKLFTEACDSINLNPGGSTPHLPVHRGITGLDEVLSMKAYQIAGVPSPQATWLQWRVVADANEIKAKDRPAGDLWGIYVVMAEMKPELLGDKALPDGLTVSAQSGIKNTPKEMMDGEKLWNEFNSKMQANPNEAWWKKNLDIRTFSSFHALNRLLGNVDLRPDGNHGYYRSPDGVWSPIPWDNDMMFVPRHHQPGFINANACLSHQSIRWAFRNRAREVLDLFASDASKSGGQIGQLTHDLGSPLIEWSKLDAALWNHHPRMLQKGSYFVNPSQGYHFGGEWSRKLDSNDFAGFQKYIVDFCTDSRPSLPLNAKSGSVAPNDFAKYAPNDGNAKGYGWGYLAFEAKDDSIPNKAKVVRVGNTFRFKASEYKTPSTNQKQALEWRLAKVGTPGDYELKTLWSKESTNELEMEFPANLFKDPGVYRVRARWRDELGKCGHWSDAAVLYVK